MEKEFIKIEETLDRLHSMQENHLHSFGKGAMPDLEKQSAERNIEMKRLMRSISDFILLAETKNDVKTESMLLVLNDHITLLIKQNKALETKVKKIRDDIKKGMKLVSKGKKVIGSYRSSAAISNKPKVISVTN